MEDCLVRESSRTALWVSFMNLHVKDTVLVLEEGNLPHPQCPRCDIFVPWEAMNGRHPVTVMCVEGVERKRRGQVEEEAHASVLAVFQAYG